jgi:protocatechuate 3,4-dioxygenase beta subunit
MTAPNDTAQSTFPRPDPGTHPPNDSPAYRSTALRHPQQPLVLLPHTLSELTGPVYPYGRFDVADADLTRQHGADPLGERIIVQGRVVDEDGRPVRQTLVEIWQANAAGRYTHRIDQHSAPLDPNFSGGGRTITDDEGRYRFVTIRPGAYPWKNHHNAWRPAHIHFSLFGTNFLTRLITQMYFPGDPLLAHDPIFNSIPEERARQRLIAGFSLDVTEPEWALGFSFDIVLRGACATPMEP